METSESKELIFFSSFFFQGSIVKPWAKSHLAYNLVVLYLPCTVPWDSLSIKTE